MSLTIPSIFSLSLYDIHEVFINQYTIKYIICMINIIRDYQASEGVFKHLFYHIHPPLFIWVKNANILILF